MKIDTKDFGKRIGRTLAAHRQQHGLTQDKVAERLQVEPETISRFERGEVIPSLLRLAELAEVYAVPIDNLLRGNTNRLLDQANDILVLLRDLSSEDRDFVRRWLEELCIRLRERTART